MVTLLAMIAVMTRVRAALKISALTRGNYLGGRRHGRELASVKKKKTLMAAAAMEASLQKSSSDDQHGNTSTGGGSCCEVVTMVSVQWLGSRHWRAKVEVALGLKMVQNCERKLLENGEARADVDNPYLTTWPN